MNIDVLARFAVGWLAFVLWTIATLTLLERQRPRHRHHPGTRRIALAAALLAIDAAIAQTLVRVTELDGSRVALAWLTTEILHYALHRAMHRIPALWRFHRLHHDGAPLAWTTTWLVHP